VTALRIAHLGVDFGATSAVRDASFDVADGEIVAIVGPSGSGKSSLLAAIAGIIPSTGTVWADGRDLTRLPAHRRGVGMVFQDGQLFPYRDVAGNIAFGLEVAGVRRHEREERVAELLALVGLDGFGKRRIDQLSGGERQRIALARSLAPRPGVLLLDEALSSLDVPLRERLAVDVRDILVATGTTTLVVTHDMAEAEVMATRTLRLVDGTLEPDDGGLGEG